MDVDFSSQVRASQSVIVQALGDELVLLNYDTNSYFGLDEVGTRLWQLLLASSTIQDAFQTLSQEYDVDPDTLKRDMKQLLEQLLRQRLIEVNGT